jgi:tetratricopeptide (TPR) repeat protein
MEAELRQRPHDPNACAKLGSLEVAEGHHRQGMELLRRGLQHCPAAAHAERYELLLHLAIAETGIDPSAAIAHYRQALVTPLPPRLTLAARLNLAALLLQRNQPEPAEELCRQATTVAPEIGLGWTNLGLIRRRRGDIAGALEAYRRAATLSPDHAETQQNLAVALLLGGDIFGARDAFQTAIRLLESQGRSGQASQLRRQAGELVRLEA